MLDKYISRVGTIVVVVIVIGGMILGRWISSSFDLPISEIAMSGICQLSLVMVLLIFVLIKQRKK